MLPCVCASGIYGVTGIPVPSEMREISGHVAAMLFWHEHADFAPILSLLLEIRSFEIVLPRRKVSLALNLARKKAGRRVRDSGCGEQGITWLIGASNIQNDIACV